MADFVEKIKPELARLTEGERADLAHFLLASLGDAEVDAAELAGVLDRRSSELRSGAVDAVPESQVMARLRAKYP